MGDLRVPPLIVVPIWIATGLAVLGYTYISFKETANGLESGAMAVEGVVNPLVAGANVLTSELKPNKPLERGSFQKSKR